MHHSQAVLQMFQRYMKLWDFTFAMCCSVGHHHSQSFATAPLENKFLPFLVSDWNQFLFHFQMSINSHLRHSFRLCYPVPDHHNHTCTLSLQVNQLLCWSSAVLKWRCWQSFTADCLHIDSPAFQKLWHSFFQAFAHFRKENRENAFAYSAAVLW